MEKGNVVIEEMHLRDGELEIRGALHFTVLYAGEEDVPVCDLAGNTPFYETVKMDCEGVREEEISLFLHDTPRIRLDIRHIVIGIYCRRNFFSTVTMVHMNLLFYKFHSPSTVQRFSFHNGKWHISGTS